MGAPAPIVASMGPTVGGFRLRRMCGTGVSALVLAAILVFLAGATGARAEIDEYTLGPGDQLRVTVFGHEDLSGVFSVTGRGVVSMPLIGEVTAGSRTVSALESAIVDALKPDYLVNPKVSVEVLNFRPFFIIGEVNKPGSYPYQHGMTVVNAVALAGGYTYRARKNKVLIKRSGSDSGKETAANESTVVLPGDVIRVPERFF